MNTGQRDNATPELWQSLPNVPGVYLMKASDGTVIYVGKAVRLRTRGPLLFSREICTSTHLTDDAVCY